MPDEDPDAGEPDEAHEVAGFVLVASVDSAMAQEPGDQALDVPSSLVPAQATTVLGFAISSGVVRSNELDPALPQLRVERVTVVRLVADQEPRERFREAGVDGFDDELLLISRTTRNPCGDRKTRAV